jgi:hypothetical protein
MTALSDFPSFTSAIQLFKALRSQEFQVDRRGPGYKIYRQVDGVQVGGFVFIHSGSITDRSGNRSKNILKELVGIGFLPPAEYEQRKRERRAMDVIVKGEAEVEHEEAQEPTEAPVDTEPDPKRAYPCEECAVARCRICIKKELPCAFAKPLNLGRHTTAIHGAASQPESQRQRVARSSKVRTRIDTDVIPNVVGRRIVQLKRLEAEMVLLMDELFTEAEALRKENQELRKFRTDVERQANALYDATTKPRNG